MTNQAEDERATHWNNVYGAKTPDEMSWFQSRPDLSLALIESTGLDKDAAILDVGGGASTLVDHLLAAKRTSLSVLDISEQALEQARRRLESNAPSVKWIVADVTLWRPNTTFDLWHDRAVLHFLTDPRDQEAYAETLRAALKPHGWAIIAGFAPDGPLKCSGLTIVQHDANSLLSLLGAGFDLIETRNEIHRTPWNAEQAFRYHLFRRKP